MDRRRPCFAPRIGVPAFFRHDAPAHVVARFQRAVFHDLRTFGTLKTCHHRERYMLPSEIIRRRNLPHWDVPTAAYFVTTCLEGSIPARGLLDLQSYRAELEQRPRPPDQTQQEWAVSRWKLAFARTDHWLDRAEATRFLADNR